MAPRRFSCDNAGRARGLVERQPILLVDENVLDGAIAIRLESFRALTRGFQAIGAMDAPEAHQPETGLFNVN